MRAAWRRTRADLWPLAVTVLVVALTVGVTDAVPRLLTDRADAAVRAAVAHADPAVDVVVTSMYGPGLSDATAGARETRASVDDAARGIESVLPPSLQPVLGSPLADATSTDLTLSTPALPTGGVLWMSYLWAGHDPAVRWLAGSAPDEPGPDGAVQLALSDEVAGVLGIGAGDTFQAMKADRTFVPVLVTGVFDAKDPDDPVWTSRPEILRPRVVGQSNAPTTVVGGLLSAASLPAARAALEPDGVTRTFRFPVEPEALDYAGSGALATQVAALEASPELMMAPGPGARVTSRLDLVLTQVRARVAATWSQATVVLAGLGWGTGLVLLVGADLLARRRSAALRTVRARGASLPGIAAEAGAEAAVVVGVGAAVGLALGQVAAPGAVSWPWVAVVVVGVLAPPAFATATAARSDARRVPTDRHGRRLAQRVRSVRRVSIEAALLVLAAAALVALRRRGVVSISGPADLALAAAPVLVAAAGALLLWRAVPVLLRGALRGARRSRKAAPLLAVARAGATGAVLPFVALVVVTTLVALCGALASTARAGQTEGSWDTVGADVVVRTTLPDASLQDVADGLAATDGVDAVAVGRVQDRSELFDVRGVDAVRVLAVDPESYGELLARTPFGAAPALAVLADASGTATTRAAPGPLPALVPEPLLGTRPSLRWGNVTIELQPVGQVPALPAQQADGTPAGPTVVVDRAALAAVVTAHVAARAERTGSERAGTEPQGVGPDTVWAVGPEASAKADAAAQEVRGHVLARTQWLTERRSDPLAGGLLALLALVAALCAGYATIIVVLAAAASAPGRATSLATARVLGLRHRATTRVAAGELLPSILVAALGGVLLGMVLVGALVAPLALRLVTGQSADPGVVLPWWSVVSVALVGAAVLVVVTVESSARRRERLGQVLRVR
ncbi:FtsX-like permease family protein [Cellulomonas humilata]|uniref:ABC transport system permease protein n=1 Tax=Cellulomonas humilata TaxID=144055 RepID=A0ABU0EBJ9_9CELL|nr:FtsX-like permease family protein [Cellulomonas humilata]MDQ0372644.1 putative ABC transport system permease protein [Cellulomonas humilata]